MKHRKNSYSARLPLAITLIITAFISAFFIATYSNKGENYWIITNPILPGQVILSTDLKLTHLNLGSSASLYLSTRDRPEGMIAVRKLMVGEVISTNDLTSTQNAMSTSAVPLSMRSLDLARGINIGEAVDIYWVLDSRNGEPVVDPILILGGVTLLNLDDSKSSLGGDIGITVAIEETQVLRLLSATTQGRLVVVRSYV